MEHSKTALIDGDIVLYRIAYQMDKPREGVDSNGFKFSIKLPRTEKEVLEEVDKYLYEIVKTAKCNRFAGFLSDKRTNTFRYKLATIAEYKGNRKERELPTHFQLIRKHLQDKHNFVTVEGYEADDALASNQTPDTIICSTDKDLLQIPGYHYNFVKDVLSFITDDEGLYKLAMQTVTGDSVDNIKGLPKVGPKTAEKWFKDVSPDELLPLALYYYIEKLGTLEGVKQFQENFQLVALVDNLITDLNIQELPNSSIIVEENDLEL